MTQTKTMTQKFTLQELLGIGYKLMHMPWITVLNYLEEERSFMSANLIEQLVHDSQDPPRIKVIIAAWGHHKLSLNGNGPWMTREEWLERLGKWNLAKRGSDYSRSHEYRLFNKYVQLGVFEINGDKFRVKVNNQTLKALDKYKNKIYFVNS